MVAIDFGRARFWAAVTLCGAVYWLLFVLVLEPDNVLRAWRMGHALSLPHEALRMTGAAMLGGAATPVQYGLARRFPLTGSQGRRNLAIHVVGAALQALGLAVLGCVMAAWAFEGKVTPSLHEIEVELAANWTLLLVAVVGLAVAVELIRLGRREARDPPRAGVDRSELIAVGAGARMEMIEVLSIDWIESQGNYAALHVGPKAHLIRRTLKDLEADLDAARFVRTHRSAIVAIDRIRALKPLTNGDALATLIDGQQVRISRGYRDEVRRRWLGA
jgi:hypothetical protein